jgi:large subunit ribosomal protein L15
MLVGRGGKRGKTSGRGTKGQNARAGRKKRPEMRDFIKRLPKLRGYAFNTIKSRPAEVKLADIETTFANGAIINPKSLVEKKLVSMFKGRFPKIKILGTGELTKKVTIEGCAVTASVREKIEKAGGKVS